MKRRGRSGSFSGFGDAEPGKEFETDEFVSRSAEFGFGGVVEVADPSLPVEDDDEFRDVGQHLLIAVFPLTEIFLQLF